MKHNEKVFGRSGKQNNQTSKSKFCTFHKSTTHNTDECRNKNISSRNNSEDRTDTKNRTLALREPNNLPKALEITGYVSNTKANLLIDTGSAFNYIKTELAEKLKLASHQTQKHEATMANWQTVSSEKISELSFRIQNDSFIDYKCRARLIQPLAADIILGMEFLLDNNVIIDVKNKYIIIDGNEYDTESDINDLHAYDKEIMNKTKILTLDSQKYVQIQSLIEKFKETSVF